MYRIWKNHTYYITEYFLYGIYPADHVCDHYDAAFGTCLICMLQGGSKWGIDYTGNLHLQCIQSRPELWQRFCGFCDLVARDRSNDDDPDAF